MKRTWARLRMWWAGRLLARSEFLAARGERHITRIQASYGMHDHILRDGKLIRELGPAKWCESSACRAMAEVTALMRAEGHK